MPNPTYVKEHIENSYKVHYANTLDQIPAEQLIENAEIIPQMDEIIKNNDKFETIRVIMEILCKELGISVDSQFPTIAGAVQRVVQDYYKSMEDWKNLRKSAIKQDIRQ